MSRLVKIFIVEDEAITRATLEDGLEEMGYEVVGYADEAERAWEKLQMSDADLVMLDINLIGEKDGIWLGGKIKEAGNMPFIYLTAFGDEKTIQRAIKTRPHGYLLKPFEQIDVYAAIEVAIENFTSKYSPPRDSKFPKTPKRKASPEEEFLFIKDDSMFVKLKKTEILYIKSDNNYLDLMLPEKRHLVRAKLSAFLEVLPQDMFLQVHRSYAINIQKVDSFGAGFVNIQGATIPVSDKYRSNVLERFPRF